MHVSKQSVINHTLLVSLRERERELWQIACLLLIVQPWKKICLLTTVRLQAYLSYAVWSLEGLDICTCGLLGGWLCLTWKMLS
jgi:hypothetical protein